MSISPISGGAGAITPIEFPGASTNTPGGVGKSTFGDSLTNAIDNLQETQTKANDLSMQVATGKLSNIHDYMIAANQAEIATQLTVAVRNKGIEAFNQIMNMSV
jgi:flagellar hook-basal body complex protein FliE